MKPRLLLRIASVLTLIHAVLHTVGGVFGAIAPGAQQVAATAMQSNRFVILGATRSYWDFYRGFGLFVTVSLLVEAVVFWQLGSIAETVGIRVRPVLMAFCIAFVGYAVLSWRYFFAAPIVFELVIAGLLLWAWVAAGTARAGTRE